MISKYTCTACKVEVTKQNGAQPGCPACGFGWATGPSQEHTPWTFPYPYGPVEPYNPYAPYEPETTWYTIRTDNKIIIG